MKFTKENQKRIIAGFAKLESVARKTAEAFRAFSRIGSRRIARNSRARRALLSGDVAKFRYYQEESFRRKFRDLNEPALAQIINDNLDDGLF